MALAPALIRARAITGGVSRRLRSYYYRALGVRTEGYVWMGHVDIPRNFGQISLSKGVALDNGVTLLVSDDTGHGEKIFIGEHTYINRNSFIDASLRIEIGKGVGIGPGCYVTDHDHGIEPGVPFLAQPLIARPTKIEDGVWLGAGCIVLKGVTIGRNTVVGAGSIVVRDLPAEIVAEGRPARAVRKR